MNKLQNRLSLDTILAMDKNQPLSKELTKQVETLYKLGAHLGHKKNRLHPQARKYIYKMLNSVSIIDLTKTVQNLADGKKALHDAAKEGKKLLVVGTKRIANQHISELSHKHQIPAVTTKWLPGLLTNFETIIKNVRKLIELKKARDNGDWEKFIKHERVQLDKKVSRLEKFYGGLVYLEKKPDIMLIVDIKKEKNAVIEAKKNNIPTVAISDTNSDPRVVTFPIVLNDDSAGIVDHVVNELIEAYVSGLSKQTAPTVTS